MKAQTFTAPNGRTMVVCPVAVHIDGEMAYDETGIQPGDWDITELTSPIYISLVEGVGDGFFQDVVPVDVRMFGRVYCAITHYRRRLQYIRNARGTNYGIMVDTDEFARLYQAWSRVVTLLEDWLQRQLGYSWADWSNELYPPIQDPWANNRELEAEIVAELETLRASEDSN